MSLDEKDESGELIDSVRNEWLGKRGERGGKSEGREMRFFEY